MTDKDYYEVLGVSKTAETKEIKQAFRRLAKKYHPDIYDGDRLVVEIVIDLDETPEESAWLFVLGAERAGAVLEQFGFSSYRAFVLKFRAAAELVAARPPSKSKRDAQKDGFPF